ncbi:transmembrane channel-like protein 7 [Chrysoperla carnea]|uniref:transmembrane channel-like protein 7 n=1 Tax=Chrysoperla carnea TaxID=189513 RepID=UPI001D06D141|nr:transmembrane channel-like protein 7 [Chrysoperla carnea]
MSGGASNKKRVSGKTQGWEEAGGEFYSERYPTGDIELDVFQRDPSHIATLLPSKQSRFATTKHGTRNTDTRTMRRRTSTRSRQSTARRTSTVNQDVHVSMMPDLSENLSNEERTWEEIMQIKAMPIPMYQKKEMKAKLQNATYLRLQGYEQFKWKQRKVWQQLELRWNELLTKIELWKYSLKKIEGNFGTGIVAYFIFLKWLMFLNLCNFIMIFIFVIMPTLLFDNEENAICDIEKDNSSVPCCSDLYFNGSVNLKPFIYDFIQGTGWIEYTLMFYGYYTNQIYGVHSVSTLLYDLPLAYILITVIYFVISLIAIVKSAARGFKERLIEGEGQFYRYCNIVFGGWDFCIHNEKSAIIKHKALYNELKGNLQAEKMEEERQSRTRDEKTRLFCLRFTINLIVIFILGSCSILIFFVIELSWDKILSGTDLTENFLNGNLENLILQFLPSMSIVALNIVIPILFRFLIKFEKYTPEYEIRLSLVRIVFLRLSSLSVLMATIYYLVSCQDNENTNECTSNGEKCKRPLCWETYVGQQIYKLLITDFAIHLLKTFLINFPRALLAKHIDNKCMKLIGTQEFELTGHVLDVVYSQTLCWLGTFFCPLLPAIAAICFFFMFYIKKFACLVNSTPSSTVYRASRSNSLFMFVLLLSFVVTVIPVGFSIAELTPSKSCGPFREYETVWELVIKTFGKFPLWIQNIIFFFGTAGFAIPLFIFLVLCLYYYYAVNSANKHMVLVLKNQLVLEGHDKQFLLNRLSAFIKQQQEYQKKLRNAEMQRERERMNNSSS